MEEENYYVSERERMVTDQLICRNIYDERLLEAMRTVPRHMFVPQEYRHSAYADGPLPIGNRQTISQPYIVALMTQLLLLQGNERVLEVGTGSGYQAAILGTLASEVHSIERHAALSQRAGEVLAGLNFTNVHLHVGDGSGGLPEFAPYDAIIITAAAPEVPRVILEQLNDSGRLVIPVGTWSGQSLERWRRHGSEYTSELLIPVAFVPLLGQYGWPS